MIFFSRWCNTVSKNTILHISRLRGSRYDPAEELKKLEDLHSSSSNDDKSSSDGCLSSLRLLLQPSVARGALLLSALMVMMMACGATVVGFYAVEVLEELVSETLFLIISILKLRF